MRAAGVPGRGENGNTCSCVSPHSSTRSSERANIASVSVGKPAMMSAPNTTSGRSRRTCSQNAIASARECRRFMRLRIMSSPACSDRCRCGISRGSSASASSRSASASTESIEDSRSRCELRHVACRICFTSAPSRRAGSRAIARDVDAGQHDLAIAVLDQPAHLRHHLAHRHRARIAAAERDDAEGAAVVAAVLHLHEARGCGLRCRRCDAARVVRTAMMSLTDDLFGRVERSPARGATASPRCRARDRPRAWRRTSAGRSAPRSR